MKRASSGMLYFLNIILVATLLVGPLAGTAHVAADTYSAPPTPQDYLPTNPKERFGLTAGQTGDMFDPTNPLATINPLSAGGGLFSDERGYWPEYAALTKRAPWSRPFRGVLADWWQRLQDGWNRLLPEQAAIADIPPAPEVEGFHLASVQSPDTRYAGPLPLDQPMTLRVPTAGPGDPQAIYLPLIQTPPFQYSQWIPVSGGVMSVPGYGLVVQVPASYYAEPLRFVFTAVAQPPNMNALTTPYNFHLNAYTASGTEVTQFSQELTLVQSYKETVLGQVDPTSLYLAYFAGEWVALPSVVDEEMGTVTAVTDHFTRFAILGPLPSCAPDPEVGEFEIMSSSATQRIRTAYEASPLTECPLDYAYTLTTINNIDYAAQEFPGGAAIVDNPNLEQAFYIPPEIWLTYEQEAFLVGGVWLPEQPSAPEHFIDETGNNFREQEIWYFEYGFASVNNGEEWETHQYFPKFPAGMFAWEQAELDSEDYPRYRLRFQSDFEPSPAAEGVETSYPTPTPVTVQMTILDVTDDTISETVPILWNGTMAAEGASDYDYYITQTLKVYVAGIREDLIGYTRCNYYEPEPDARRYYYLTPTYPGPHNFEHNCIGGGMADTTPPDIEILQVYGSDVDPNSKWLEATVVVRITDDFGIASAAIQTSHGIVTQELQPYLSITYQNDPDVYAATFTEIPEHTTVTFTIEATDNSGLSASETANGYFADGQSFGFSACFNPCSSQLMGHQGKASPNPISDFGAKTEVYPLLAIPGPGEANVVIMPVYNSNSIRTGIFGAGISSDLETHLVMLYNPLVNGVEVVIGDGGRFRFEDNGDGTFTAVSQGNEDSLIQDGDGYVYTTRDQRIYRFDSNGRLASKEDRNGNAITYTYSGEQLTDITSGGRTVTLAYNGDGYVETLSIGEKTITLSYDGDKLVGIEDAMGGDWELTYESREIGEIIDERGEEFAYVAYNHFLTSVTTPARRIKNVQDYDEQGRVIHQISSLAGELLFSYVEHADGRRETHITDAHDRTEIHYYNTLGQLVQVHNRDGRDEYYQYDDNFHLIHKVDFNGYSWEYDRDENGNIIELYGPEGLRQSWTYNEFNEPTFYRDGDGFAWTWQYDDRGNMIRADQPTPDGRHMTVTYDGRGLPTDIYDYNGNHIHLEYDPFTGDLLATKDGENLDGVVTRFEYDEYGRRIRMILPLGNVWDYTYDLNDNLTHVYGPLEYHAEFEYDDDNLLIREQDADTYETTYTYDERGRLVETRNGENEPISFTYGSMNELQTMANGRGAVTTFAHDELYRVIEIRAQINATDWVTETFEYDGLGNVLFATDGEGRVTATTYDGLSRPFAVVQNYIENGPQNADTNVVTTFGHDYRGHVITLTNALDGVREFGFDSVGYPAWVENEEDERTILDYDPNGNLVRTQFPEENFIEFEYNGRNQPQLFRDGEGFEFTYEYDANGNLTHAIDPDLTTLRYDYNQLDQRVLQTANYQLGGPFNHDSNVTTHYDYSPAGDLREVIDGEEYVFAFFYDRAHRLVRETNPEGESEYIYDDAGNLERRIDANEHIWRFEYDLLNRPITAVNPETHAFTYKYDNVGNLTAVTDPRNNTTHTTYDALNRPVDVLNPLNYHTTFTWDAIGNLLAQTDGNGHITRFEYDLAQRLTARVDAEGFRTEFAYDNNGRLSQRTIPFADPAQTIVEQFAYDGRDLLLSHTNGEGEITQYGYNSVGLLAAKTENDGVITAYGYDGLRRLNNVTLNHDSSQPAIDDWNVAYHYTYDRVGNLVSVVDPLDHETLFDYNGLGSLVYERNPIGNEWTYTYDPAQNLISRLDANNNLTQYSYYDDNQLHIIDYTHDADVVYSYDRNNNPITMHDGLGETSWEYDALNRVTAVTDSLGRTIHTTYDAVNRTAITYPDGLTVNYTYLDNDWMSTVTDPVGGLSQYSYDAAGRITGIDHPNNTFVTRTYDRANRLLTLGNYQDGGDILSAFAYEYDAVGQRVQATNSYGWQNPAVVTENYSYDGLRRLTGVADSEGMVASYGYDRAGNRTLWQTNDDPFGQSPQDGFTATYSYNAANQLLTADIQRTPPAQSESITYQYDGNGNRIDRLVQGNGADQGMAYTYDDENRLVSAYSYQVGGGGNINWQDETTMAYDGLGRRLVETYDPHSGGGGLKRTEYSFDGLDPIAEYDLWDGHQRNYYRGAGNQLIQLHHFPAGSQGQQYWHHHNGHGDVAGLTKQLGQSTHNYRYDAYGGVIPDNGNWLQPHNEYALTEKAFDTHTGLYYFGARYYDAGTAVWITQDTYRGGAGDPLNLHRYKYVFNSPTNYFDPYGFQGKGFWRDVQDLIEIKINQHAIGLNVTNAERDRIYAQELYMSTAQTIRAVEKALTRELNKDELDCLEINRLFEQLVSLGGDLELFQQQYFADGSNDLSFIDRFQTYLDVAGLIPVVGEPIDLINGLIYLSRGKYLDAGLSLVAVIPVIGSAGTGGKLAKGAVKASDVINIVDTAGDTARTLNNVSVYRSINNAGQVQYVGITNDFSRRAAEHSGRFDIKEIPGLTNLSRQDARAVEQVLINYHGFADDGGTLLNKINSISPNNPVYNSSLSQGEQILLEAGYTLNK